jgi:hypothetical protein
MKENRSNKFDYPQTNSAGTTVLEKFCEKRAQGPLKDRMGVVGVYGKDSGSPPLVNIA